MKQYADNNGMDILKLEARDRYREWAATDPICCRCKAHTNDRGETVGMCHREQTWRQYVKARDAYLASLTEKNPGLRFTMRDVLG